MNKWKTLFLSLLACAPFYWVAFASSQPLHKTAVDAACAAQAFLSRNGYLDAPATPDRSQIALEMWDRVKYEKKGILDWDRLLADRRNSYSGKLWAIKKDANDYLVVYRFPNHMSCVRVSENLSAVHLHEANCKPKKETLTLLAERDLNCASAGAPR